MSLARRRVARALRARYGVSTPEAAERTREALELRRRQDERDQAQIRRIRYLWDTATATRSASSWRKPLYLEP